MGEWEYDLCRNNTRKKKKKATCALLELMMKGMSGHFS